MEISGILRVVVYPRSTWSKGSLITGMTIGEDNEMNAYIWAVPLSRDDASSRYFVSVHGKSVLIKILPDGSLLFPSNPDQSERCREDIKSFTREAFIAGGILLQDGDKVDEWNRLLEIKFVASEGSSQ